MNVLCVGDIFGKPGRMAAKQILPRLIETHEIDFVIVNAENAAGGNGLTCRTAMELLKLPVNVLTTGNHVWRFKEIEALLDQDKQRLLRPLNFPQGTPGAGYTTHQTDKGTVAVVNLQGRIFMDPILSPFEVGQSIVDQIRQQTPIIVVDFHAEATSEKRALGWFLDGTVSAVVGTHTHVQTADEEILPQGTAYLTDLGMTGPYRSVIGMQTDAVLKRFLSARPVTFSAAKSDVRLCGAIISIDESSGKATRIQRVREHLETAA